VTFDIQVMTIAWYALHGDPDADLNARRVAAPWYRQKATISYADMLAALRHDLIRMNTGHKHPARPSTHKSPPPSHHQHTPRRCARPGRDGRPPAP